ATGKGRTDDTDGRALGISAERAQKSRGHADLRAVGDDHLLRLAAALGVEDIEGESVLLEDAGILSELGDEGLADAARAHRDLEVILRGRSAPRRHRSGDRKQQRAGPRTFHAHLPSIASVPVPKFASLCGALACELRNRRTPERVLINRDCRRSLTDVRNSPMSARAAFRPPIEEL